MIRRTLLMGLGGFAGLVLWYFLLAPADIQRHARFAEYSLALCVLGCGILTMTICEKLRIIPTQEQLDHQSRPISLFSADNQDPKS